MSTGPRNHVSKSLYKDTIVAQVADEAIGLTILFDAKNE